jgi:hypothetical protein|nr:hypothetical protein [uncultured Glaciecola sp.]
MIKQSAPIEKYSTNWMQNLDGRTAVAQELRQRHSNLCDDLGGYPSLSYQQRAMIDRAIFLEFHLQQQELILATGADFDSGKWVQACNALSGLFAKLGLNRQVKEVTSLSQYVKQAS